MSKLYGIRTQRPVPPPKKKILPILANKPEVEIEPFPWCAISHEN